MLKRLKWVLPSLIALFVVIQLVRLPRTNPPVDTKREIYSIVAVDTAIASAFSRSCNDCHSNQTVWPWYSHVAPASWLVTYDVNKGRGELNFSEWGKYDPEKKAELLDGICKEVTEGEMPGTSYTLLHPNSKLSAADVKAICRWTRTTSQNTPVRADTD
ncbi:MAG TPA: heme-binding domain-containing protein [Candidatus Limnocylindria bacterium]|nr:heme-binding domain-containing protein [Candidatus Limnocylindria bacterium]